MVNETFVNHNVSISKGWGLGGMYEDWTCFKQGRRATSDEGVGEPKISCYRAAYTPSPIDYSLPLLNQLQVHQSSEMRSSQEALSRRNNVVVRGLYYDETVEPLTAARSFSNFRLYQNGLLNRSPFYNHWKVDNILNSAHSYTETWLRAVPYRAVYLDKDRSPGEMKEHRRLLAELKVKIAEDSTKRRTLGH